MQNTFENQVWAKFRTEELAPFQIITVELNWIKSVTLQWNLNLKSK